jgi:hypothetical protein
MAIFSKHGPFVGGSNFTLSGGLVDGHNGLFRRASETQ